jgi:RNA polymerase sigma-70 factor (ECF subfamily)
MNNQTRIEDEWLALRCQTNEPHAYSDLVSVMELPLLYYATKMTGSRETALDVLQETWIRALRGIRKLKVPGSLRPWLYRIVHGIAVDYIRKNVVREQSEVMGMELSELANEAAFTSEDASLVHSALDELEPSHREVLVLFFLEEFSIFEIAQITGVPQGTVKSRLHYAKKAMRDVIKGGTYAKHE